MSQVPISEPQIPPPAAYGLPADKFSEWRQWQPTATVRGIETTKRFPMIVAPTGFGKSAVAESIARYVGRSAYLTITKGLQSQIGEAFADRFDIRGKSNYDCKVLNDAGVVGWRGKVSEADELCAGCSLKDGGCRFYDDMRRARGEERLITNYAKWLATSADLLGEFDILVCDEAHGAADQISKSVRIEVRPELVERFCNTAVPGEQSWDEWKAWAGKWYDRLKPRLDGLVARVKAGERSKADEMRLLKQLVNALEKLKAISAEWIEDRGTEDRIGFEPLWPRRYGERLFRGIKRVVLTSATVDLKDADLLGIDRSAIDFAEYPSSFPLERRPFYVVPTVVQRQTMSDAEKVEAVRRLDQIIEHRLDRKGLVQTVSFDRARHVLQHSRYRSLMLMNEPRGEESQATAAIVERYKRAKPPCYLVTPSIIEGYDFPHDECRFIAWMKIPLLNRHASKITDARCQDDREYDGWQAVKKVQQGSGRHVRERTDWGETFMLDDTWSNWFWRLNSRHARRWFAAAVHAPGPIPPPMRF